MNIWPRRLELKKEKQNTSTLNFKFRISSRKNPATCAIASSREIAKRPRADSPSTCASVMLVSDSLHNHKRLKLRPNAVVPRRRSNSIPWCTSIHAILSLRTWHIIISNLQHAWSEHRSQCSMWMVSKHVSVQQLLLLRLSSWLIFTVL